LKVVANGVFGHQDVITEVLVMVEKSLNNILPDKIENRKADWLDYMWTLDLNSRYSDMTLVSCQLSSIGLFDRN